MKTVVSKDGTKIAYDVYGKGPALINIMGTSCFRKLLPLERDAKTFGKEFTVYHYDRRGRGDSGNTLPWSLERELEDVEALIDAAGGQAFLYGHSAGSIIALEASLALSNKVKKTVLYDLPYVHDEDSIKDNEIFVNKLDKLLEDGNNAGAIKTFYTAIGLPKPIVTILPITPYWKSMKALAPTLKYDMTLRSDMPPVERASKDTVPTLVISGQKSQKFFRVSSDMIAKAIPGAEEIKLENENHLVRAKTLLPFFVNFLKK